jgi:hypothetical protein
LGDGATHLGVGENTAEPESNHQQKGRLEVAFPGGSILVERPEFITRELQDMGFWHTGYAEFHESTGLGDQPWVAPPPVRYRCQQCTESFTEVELLRKHRFEQHPVRQPTLLLLGTPVGAVPQRLMTPLSAADVAIEDATICLLNGRPVEVSSMGRRLAAMRCDYAEVELLNQGATTRCVLDFCVADEAHLAGVEAAFLRLARARVLNLQAVSLFNDDCRASASAMRYCDGISHYLYGVMAKERSPDSGLNHEEYIPRFLRSSDELSGFHRPLARSVRSLVAFHFNHFADAESMAPAGTLSHTAGAFAGLLQGLSWPFDEGGSTAPASAVEDLLTDQDTLQILVDASLGPVGLKARADELLAHLSRTSVDGHDHMKRMLLACEALAACGDSVSRTEARRLARESAANTDTRVWAKAMLERLSTP